MRTNRFTLCLTVIATIAGWVFNDSLSSAQQGSYYQSSGSRIVAPAKVADPNRFLVPSNPDMTSPRPNGGNVGVISDERIGSAIIQMQDQPVQDDKTPNLGQVPNAPSVNDTDKPKEPGLEVQSNAEDVSPYCKPSRRSLCQIDPFPKRLFGQTPGGFAIGGWAQLGYHPISNNLFNSHPRRPHMQQFWLFGEKAANRNSMGWDWGFRLDAIYGVDGQNLQAFGNSPPAAPDGWDNSWDHGIYGWAMPQAYVELANGPMSVKAGHFLSPIGYESVASVDNFFYSRSYMRTLAQPYTLSGVMGDVQLSDNLSAFGAVTTGWDTGFDQIGNALYFFGGAIWRPSQNVTIQSVGSIGDTGIRGNGFSQNLTADLALTQNLNWGFQADWFETDTFDDVGFTNYLIYKASECFAVGSRLEFFRTDRFGGDRSTWSWSNGANFRPHSNLVIRPEVRLDWGPAAARNGQGLFAVDAILVF